MQHKGRIILYLCIICFFLTGCARTYHGTDELTEKAREEFPISEADTTEVRYAGMIGKGDKAIAWFISGSEYQYHCYLPMEIGIKGNAAEYTFIRTLKPMDRGLDIAVLQWDRGYCFLINNSECSCVRITDNSGTHEVAIEKDEYPFVFYNELLPSEYYFLDKNGNVIH